MLYAMIPVAILMAHSLYLLVQKYEGRKQQPLWFKIYLICGYFFIVAVPTLVAMDICSWFGYDEGPVPAYTGLFVSIFFMVLLINVLKKNQNDEDQNFRDL